MTDAELLLLARVAREELAQAARQFEADPSDLAFLGVALVPPGDDDNPDAEPEWALVISGMARGVLARVGVGHVELKLGLTLDPELDAAAAVAELVEMWQPAAPGCDALTAAPSAE